MMAVSEEDIKEEEQIQEDFKKAKEILCRIRKEFHCREANEDIAFLLCLVYCRQLKYHKYEKAEAK